MEKRSSLERKNEGRIFFCDWILEREKELFGQQFDHLSRTLKVEGELPQGWEWIMMVKSGENMDCLPLDEMDDGIGIVLNAQQLSVAGYYQLQLKGKKGEMVRHTNTINVRVGTSLSGDLNWPEIPSHFSVIEQRVYENAETVKGYALHPPVIGGNGNWQLWNGDEYADSGYSPIESLMAALPNGDEVSY